MRVAILSDIHGNLAALDAFGLERYYRKLGFVDRPHLNW